MASFIQKIRKSKIQLTQRQNSVTRNNSKSKEQISIKTPPKFRTIQTQSSTTVTSRYQTLQKNNRIQLSQQPQSKSLKKKNLSIDTESINQQFQIKQLREYNKSLMNDNPLICEDSVTLLSRMYQKRKQQCKLLQAKKLNNSCQDDDFMINHSKDHFTLSQSKMAVFDSRVLTTNPNLSTNQNTKFRIHDIKYQLQQLKSLMGNNNKITQISRLLADLQEQLLCHSNFIQQQQYSFKTHQRVQSNQIQNYIMKQNSQSWFTKPKEKLHTQTTTTSNTDDKKRVRTMNIQYQSIDRIKNRNGLKSKCPLTEIVNYVNRKR